MKAVDGDPSVRGGMAAAVVVLACLAVLAVGVGCLLVLFLTHGGVR